MTITVNDTPISYFNFSGGECQVNLSGINIDFRTEVQAFLHHSDEVMRLLMTIDAIRQKNADTEIHLIIPYFPYARQDRVCSEGEAFGLKVMADLINATHCASVTVVDPHSKVTPALLNNCRVVTQAELLADSVIADHIRANHLSLVSPDKGAEPKTKDLSEHLGIKAVYCTKTRDPKTGAITSTKIPDGVAGQSFIILDDICDGGRTFIELAKAFKEAGAEDLYLYTTHGIYSKGLKVLQEHFKKIFCYHCFLQPEDIDTEFLVVLEEKNENQSLDRNRLL